MRYRHAWPGFLLLAALAVLLGALLAWGDHFLSPGPTGGIRRLLQLWAASRPAEDVPAAGVARPGDIAGDGAAAASPLTGGEFPRPAPPPSSEAPPRLEPASAAPPAKPGLAISTRAQPRFALDLGTFVVAEEAERAEAQLNQAGFSTVRFRQQEPVRMFSVFLSAPAEPEGQQLALDRLREDGFPQAVIVGGPDGPALRVVQSVPLRTAVRIGERLRAAGHEPRVAIEAARTGQITLRHGNFTSREEAEAIGREITRLGVPNEVVQIP